MPEENKLSDDTLVSAILTYPNASLQTVADRMGVSLQSIHFRIAQPSFREKLAVRRGVTVADAFQLAKSFLPDAIQRIAQEMGNMKAYPSERLTAAKMMVDTTVKLSEIADYEPKLAQLRAALEEKGIEIKRKYSVTFAVEESLEVKNAQDHSGATFDGAAGCSTVGADRATGDDVGESGAISPEVLAKLAELRKKFTAEETQ